MKWQWTSIGFKLGPRFWDMPRLALPMSSVRYVIAVSLQDGEEHSGAQRRAAQAEMPRLVGENQCSGRRTNRAGRRRKARRRMRPQIPRLETDPRPTADQIRPDGNARAP